MIAGAGLDYSNPHLTYSSEDRLRTTLAFYRSPGGIAHVSFEPWAAWPPSVSPVFEPEFPGSLWTVFDVTQSFDGRFGILVHAGSSFVFAPEMDTSSSDVGTSLALGGMYFGFVKRGGPGSYLVGAVSDSLLANVVTYPAPGAIPLTLTVELGCGESVSDAVPWQDGWLVAFSQSNDCSTSDAKYIHIEFLSALAHLPIAVFEASDSVNQLHAVPHPDGMRIAYRHLDTGSDPIETLRVDFVASSIQASATVTPPGLPTFDVFATAALGSEMAVVWGRNPLTAPEVVVSVLGDDGNKLTESSFAVSNYSNLVAISAPEGDGLLVARDIYDGPPGNVSIGLTRFDCVR